MYYYYYTYSCAEYEWYWINWDNGFITFGFGKVVGRNVLLTYTDLDPLDINYFSVSSLSSSIAYFLVPSQFYSAGNKITTMYITDTHVAGIYNY